MTEDLVAVVISSIDLDFLERGGVERKSGFEACQKGEHLVQLRISAIKPSPGTLVDFVSQSKRNICSEKFGLTHSFNQA